MRNKIIAFILSVCTIIPFALLFVSAAEPENEYIKQAEEEGFNNFCNVENYVNNAGREGFDELKVLRVDTPYETKIYHDEGADEAIGIDFYIYNPNLEKVDMFTNNAYISSFGRLIYTTSEGVEGYCSLGFSDFSKIDNSFVFNGCVTHENRMFYRVSAKLRIDIVDLSTLSSLHLVELRLRDPSIHETSNYNDCYDGYYCNSYYVIPLDCDFSISMTDYILTNSRPMYDLALFSGKRLEEIQEEYPDLSSELPAVGMGDRKPELAFLYEAGYGTDDYALYLYIYNPYPNTVNYKLWDTFAYWLYETADVSNQGSFNQ